MAGSRSKLYKEVRKIIYRGFHRRSSVSSTFFHMNVSLREYALTVENTDLFDFLLHKVDDKKIHMNCQKQIYNFLRTFTGNSKPAWRAGPVVWLNYV